LKPTAEKYVNIAELLLYWGASPSARGGYYGSALNAAVFSESLEMLSLLLDRADRLTKEKPSSAQQNEELYGNALMFAILQLAEPLPQVKLLVQHKANVNFKAIGSIYLHPLDAASYRGFKEVVSYLLESNADIDAAGGQYGNALRAAIAAGEQEIAVMLIDAGADYESRDAEYGNILQTATYEGEEEVVNSLLTKGAHLNIKDLAQRTILHIAAWRGSPDIMRTILLSFSDNLEREHCIHAKNAWGVTPLQEARDAIGRSPPTATANRTEWAPERVVQILEEYEMRAQHSQEGDRFGEKIKGPSITGKRQEGMAKPVSTAPSLNPGLGFEAVIVDFFRDKFNEFELHQVKKTYVDSLLYNPEPDKIMDSDFQGVNVKGSEEQSTPNPSEPPAPDPLGDSPMRTLRWIHLPGNNVRSVPQTSLTQETNLI
jgi:ankyrin repeat protein